MTTTYDPQGDPLKPPTHSRTTREYTKPEQRSALAILSALLVLACCCGAVGVAALAVFVRAVS